MADTKTVEVRGPVRSPLPMNPTSKVWPVYNPNILVIRTGAWANQTLSDLFDR
jgi:hypothetical protein